MPSRSEMIALVERSPFVRASDFRSAGFHPRTIAQAVDDYEIARLAPGLYCSLATASLQYIDYAVLNMLTGGVIFGMTAAAVHKLSNAQPPTKIQMIVPNEFNNRINYAPVNLYRSRRPEALTEGVVDYSIGPGIAFKITNEARTVVDLYRNSAMRQHARDALSDYIDKGFSQIELDHLAETFGVQKEIDAHLEMISFFKDRGMAPK